ncbi:hypothetical protein [Leptospira santarosai]|uniref:PF07600 family protein n=1 Tax=Leptospira santarosai TaxID=28183 RepID=A0AB73M6H6_9LEPT|nr:hypothetical protein [Leptospira santarosai]AVV50648.1 Uncharacterized protein XB17_02064 [Leptospira santarosai]ONF92549.1 hypothetical protein BWD14_12730 [Leptospira santarosai]
MGILARRFIKVKRYDFYYSRVNGIAENLNAKNNYYLREEEKIKEWIPWSVAVARATQKFAMQLQRIGTVRAEDAHINASWENRFFYLITLFRRHSAKINKTRYIQRIVDSLNKFSFFKSSYDSNRKLFSYSAFLESSKLNAYNRELNIPDDQEIYTKWSQAVKLNCNKLNKPFFLNPIREISAWDHCYHRSEIGLKTFVSDSWERTIRQCWNSIERLSQRWDKRQRNSYEISDFEN